MIALLFFLLRLLASPFKSTGRLETENAALRHQLIVVQRKVHSHVEFTNSNRSSISKTIKILDLVIPVSFLLRADEVIE